MTLTAEEVYAKIKATDRLPSPTGVVLEIIRLADNKETTAVSIAPVVESDPAIGSRLIRLANAPVSGRARQVSSIHQAVAFLGLRTTKIVALGFSLVSSHRSGGCSPFDYDLFWSESLARAATVRHLCARTKALSPDEGFTVGLLSQVGRLAMVSVFPERYAQFMGELESADPDQIRQVEAETFLIHSDMLTAAMISDWGLPDSFSNAMRFQGDPENAPDDVSCRLSHMIHLARTVGEMVVTRTAEERQLALLRKSAAALQIPAGDVDGMFDEIVAEWQEAGSIFEIRTRHIPPLSTLLELANEKRKNIQQKVREQESELRQRSLDAPTSQELHRLKSLASELAALTKRVDQFAALKTEIAKRHEAEIARLQEKLTVEIEPIQQKYTEALEQMVVAEHAAERLKDFIG